VTTEVVVGQDRAFGARPCLANGAFGFPDHAGDAVFSIMITKHVLGKFFRILGDVRPGRTSRNRLAQLYSKPHPQSAQIAAIATDSSLDA